MKVNREFCYLLNCTCKPKYSIKPHGDGHAIYFGRCMHKHGHNIAHITNVKRTDILQYFEDSLNQKYKDDLAQA